MTIDYYELYGEFMYAIQPHVFSYEHGEKAAEECCEVFRKYHETILSANDADPRDALLAQAREALDLGNQYCLGDYGTTDDRITAAMKAIDKYKEATHGKA